jgi:hypothetical protein
MEFGNEKKKRARPAVAPPCFRSLREGLRVFGGTPETTGWTPVLPMSRNVDFEDSEISYRGRLSAS